MCITALSYMAYFSIAMGPIIWVYSSKILRQRLRVLECAIDVVNQVVSAVLSIMYVLLYNVILPQRVQGTREKNQKK